MKRWIFVFIAVFIISCTENEATQSTSENEAGSSLITEETGTEIWKHNSFKKLYDFYKIYDSSFTPDSLVLVQQSTFEDYQAETIDVNKLQPFRKLISYNTDSTFGVDLFFYNYLPRKIGERIYVEAGEPDMEASLIDVKKKQKKRLLFLGPSYILFEAQWLNRNEIVIAGAEIISENKIKPLLWKINPEERMAEMYNYSGAIESNASTILGARLAHGDLFFK
jgi:hypothetical protein